MTQKSLKSIQLLLNEVEVKLSAIFDAELTTVTKGAYTQAREKMGYSAFIELSNDIREGFYEDEHYHQYRGFRLVGIDGSLITLPNTQEMKEHFTKVSVVNQYKDKNKTIVKARMSVAYDLLNGVVLDAVLTDNRVHETTIVKQNHLQKISSNDLVILDRGYPSYEMFTLLEQQSDYLIRIKSTTYKKYTSTFFDEKSDVDDAVITIRPTTKQLKQYCIDENLPLELKVRFVRVELENGEVEVLATSVLDTNRLSTDDFKELYFKRWGIETYYDIVKNRLTLENFTGITPHAIYQDFYATIFITNMEALISYELNLELETKPPQKKYQQKVNKSVALNTIKNYAFELLYLDADINHILQQIYQLLQTSLVSVRPNRKYKRPSEKEGKVTKGIKRANYHRYQKKIVF